MSKAIKITLKKEHEGYDLGASKLFGAPVFPEGWEDRFTDEVIFFGQIRLSDIADLDTEGRLPHKGYLYLLLDTEVYPYKAWTEYSEEEAKLVIDDFNESVDGFEHLKCAYLMSFEECDEDHDGTRLFGVPSSEVDDDGELLLQFDPLDGETDFLDEIDGYAYFFFGEGEDRIKGTRFVIDRS